MVLRMSGSICLKSPSQTIMHVVILTKVATPAAPGRRGYLMTVHSALRCLQRTATVPPAVKLSRSTE